MIVAEEYRSKTSLNDRGKKISVENYNKREKFFYYFLITRSPFERTSSDDDNNNTGGFTCN